MADKRLPRTVNVLAVDDKRANLIALEAVLGDQYKIIFAFSGAEAIAVLRNKKPVDIILMDVQMPDLDGFETAQRVKQLPGCEDIPIIFVTAVFTEDPFVKKGYESGGIDYFSKPFDPDILRMKLAVYASYRLHDELVKVREKAVAESEELLRVGRKLSLLLEGLPIGVLIADGEGRICQTTEEVTRILGALVPMQDDVYGDLLGWWHASGRMIKDQGGPLSRAIQYGESSHSEPLRIRSLEGNEKTILVSASPLRGLEGKIVGAVVLVQDLTESKKVIEEELEKRVTKLISLGVELEESAARS